MAQFKKQRRALDEQPSFKSDSMNYFTSWFRKCQ